MAKKALLPEEQFNIYQTYVRHNFDIQFKSQKQWLTSPKVKAAIDQISFAHMNEIYIEFSKKPENTRNLLDFNYLVDMLEDEFSRRGVFTTKHQSSPSKSAKT